ncbi:MAG: hypothetical protein MUC92_00785 [Fimbriimonadaceae bacterium]|nr:hypothetical protein [Fimbriimonadaceae bacterium]
MLSALFSLTALERETPDLQELGRLVQVPGYRVELPPGYFRREVIVAGKPTLEQLGMAFGLSLSRDETSKSIRFVKSAVQQDKLNKEDIRKAVQEWVRSNRLPDDTSELIQIVKADLLRAQQSPPFTPPDSLSFTKILRSRVAPHIHEHLTGVWLSSGRTIWVENPQAGEKSLPFSKSLILQIGQDLSQTGQQLESILPTSFVSAYQLSLRRDISLFKGLETLVIIANPTVNGLSVTILGGDQEGKLNLSDSSTIELPHPPFTDDPSFFESPLGEEILKKLVEGDPIKPWQQVAIALRNGAIREDRGIVASYKIGDALLDLVSEIFRETRKPVVLPVSTRSESQLMRIYRRKLDDMPARLPDEKAVFFIHPSSEKSAILFTDIQSQQSMPVKAMRRGWVNLTFDKWMRTSPSADSFLSELLSLGIGYGLPVFSPTSSAAEWASTFHYPLHPDGTTSLHSLPPSLDSFPIDIGQPLSVALPTRIRMPLRAKVVTNGRKSLWWKRSPQVVIQPWPQSEEAWGRLGDNAQVQTGIISSLNLTINLSEGLELSIPLGNQYPDIGENWRPIEEVRSNLQSHWGRERRFPVIADIYR